MNATSRPTVPPTPGDVVSMRGVSVVYETEGRRPVHALGSIDLDIRAGEVVSLIGPSGCGKSTLLNVAAGLQRPTAGHVTVAGHSVTGPLPNVTAMVFQDYGLFPWFTVQRNVEVALEFQGVRASERRARAIEELRKVGLEDFLHALPKHLSGGMRQRVGIARALSLRTPVIMMDEPFGALDEQTRTVLGEELSVLLANEGKTILLVTHSLSEAVFLSNRIVVMSSRPGSIKAVLEVPGDHPRTPEFMTTPEFHAIRDELFELMHAEMRASVLSERGG
ncbi:MAG TPA: ABC transporter ATP-binding protein [Ilumatobacter sp.]|nr:ABC transporter ATP-binding protein [Ilumatobacter sp.]